MKAPFGAGRRCRSSMPFAESDGRRFGGRHGPEGYSGCHRYRVRPAWRSTGTASAPQRRQPGDRAARRSAGSTRPDFSESVGYDLTRLQVAGYESNRESNSPPASSRSGHRPPRAASAASSREMASSTAGRRMLIVDCRWWINSRHRTALPADIRRPGVVSARLSAAPMSSSTIIEQVPGQESLTASPTSVPVVPMPERAQSGRLVICRRRRTVCSPPFASIALEHAPYAGRRR